MNTKPGTAFPKNCFSGHYLHSRSFLALYLIAQKPLGKKFKSQKLISKWGFRNLPFIIRSQFQMDIYFVTDFKQKFHHGRGSCMWRYCNCQSVKLSINLERLCCWVIDFFQLKFPNPNYRITVNYQVTKNLYLDMIMSKAYIRTTLKVKQINKNEIFVKFK